MDYTSLCIDFPVKNCNNYSNSLWSHVAKSKGSLKRIKWPKPRYGPPPFSIICFLISKDLICILFHADDIDRENSDIPSDAQLFNCHDVGETDKLVVYNESLTQVQMLKYVTVRDSLGDEQNQCFSPIRLKESMMGLRPRQGNLRQDFFRLFKSHPRLCRG